MNMLADIQAEAILPATPEDHAVEVRGLSREPSAIIRS